VGFFRLSSRCSDWIAVSLLLIAADPGKLVIVPIRSDHKLSGVCDLSSKSYTWSRTRPTAPRGPREAKTQGTILSTSYDKDLAEEIESFLGYNYTLDGSAGDSCHPTFARLTSCKALLALASGITKPAGHNVSPSNASVRANKVSSMSTISKQKLTPPRPLQISIVAMSQQLAKYGSAMKSTSKVTSRGS
jgi:hypothetical protein